MTERTTPITVHLTDEQMGIIECWPDSTNIVLTVIRDAVIEQRPRPIAVGDRVTNLDDPTKFEVKAIEGQWAWLFVRGVPSASWPQAALSNLTRVNDEATA